MGVTIPWGGFALAALPTWRREEVGRGVALRAPGGAILLIGEAERAEGGLAAHFDRWVAAHLGRARPDDQRPVPRVLGARGALVLDAPLPASMRWLIVIDGWLRLPVVAAGPHASTTAGELEAALAALVVAWPPGPLDFWVE